MRGDSIVVEAYHREPVEKISPYIFELLCQGDERLVVSVAGESGSGKSETAQAIANGLKSHDIDCVIFSQDDYFVHPPQTNDRTRRADADWLGVKEVRLDLLDEHMRAFLGGATEIEKPLIDYGRDVILTETKSIGKARVAIAEGTYTSLLDSPRLRIFIDRTYLQTREHREKRNRHESELDAFTEKVLEAEHAIITAHKDRADVIIADDGTVTFTA